MAWSGEQKRLENKKKNLDSKLRFSAWTPLNHSPTNDKVMTIDVHHLKLSDSFGLPVKCVGSRAAGVSNFKGNQKHPKACMKKEKMYYGNGWNDAQRRASLIEITERCTLGQLQFIKHIAVSKLPVVCQDFTRELPRAICLYIFSFLDPRSLCRCAQVCWYWKYLTELDQIWMPKALRLGWYLTFSPSPYETGVWKRHYLENVRSLHYVNPKESSIPAHTTPELNGTAADSPKTDKTNRRSTPKLHVLKSIPPKPLNHKPWRVNAPVAEDIKRNNYLDNNDEILQQRQRRHERSKQMRERRNSTSASDLTKDHDESMAKKSQSAVSMAYKLKKAKSSSNIASESKPSSNLAPDRPMWAQNVENMSPDMLVTADTIGGKDASKRPSPLTRNIPPSAAVRRNQRDLPVEDLFPTQGWQPIDISDDEG